MCRSPNNARESARVCASDRPTAQQFSLAARTYIDTARHACVCWPVYEHRIARQEIDVSLDGTSLVSTALGWLPCPKAYYTGPMRILRLVSLTTVNHFSPIVIYVRISHLCEAGQPRTIDARTREIRGPSFQNSNGKNKRETGICWIAE